MMEKLKALWVKYRQIATYCIAGGLTFLVNIGLFELLYYVLDINKTIANVIAVASAVVFAYVANKLFVFRTRCKSIYDLFREMVSFFAARGVTMLIEIGGGVLLMDVFKLDERWSKIGLTILVIILNYVFSRLFVFHKRSEEKT